MLHWLWVQVFVMWRLGAANASLGTVAVEIPSINLEREETVHIEAQTVDMCIFHLSDLKSLQVWSW